MLSSTKDESTMHGLVYSGLKKLLNEAGRRDPLRDAISQTMAAVQADGNRCAADGYQVG
jgi:hypothetical protein